MKKIIFLVLLAAIAVSCGNEKAELDRKLEVKDSLYNDAVSKMTTLRSDKIELENIIATLTGRMDTLQMTVDTLQKDTAALRAEIACLKVKMVQYKLTPNCEPEPVKVKAPAKKTVVKAPTKVTVKKEPAPAPSVAIVTYEPAPTKTTVIAYAPIQSEEIWTVAFVSGGKPLEMCLQINGLENGFVPHLAMMNGMRFTEVADNGRGGYNFVIRNTTQNFIGDYGLTNDGIFYVRKSVVDKAYRFKITSIDFRYTNHWNPMPGTLMNDYYCLQTK
jgi:hypothetical protein